VIANIALILVVATALQILQNVLCVDLTMDLMLRVNAQDVLMVYVLNVEQIILNVKYVLRILGYQNWEFVKDVFKIGVIIVRVTRVYV